ncbi:hypothetical protein ACLB2K_055833 [Fragaria x ananassa]
MTAEVKSEIGDLVEEEDDRADTQQRKLIDSIMIETRRRTRAKLALQHMGWTVGGWAMQYLRQERKREREFPVQRRNPVIVGRAIVGLVPVAVSVVLRKVKEMGITVGGRSSFLPCKSGRRSGRRCGRQQQIRRWADGDEIGLARSRSKKITSIQLVFFASDLGNGIASVVASTRSDVAARLRRRQSGRGGVVVVASWEGRRRWQED